MVTGNRRPGAESSVITNVKRPNILLETDIATNKMCTLLKLCFVDTFHLSFILDSTICLKQSERGMVFKTSSELLT